MKAHKNWSYRPYKPLFFDSGDIYICAIAPLTTQLRFDWLPLFEGAQYGIFLRKRNAGEFRKIADTMECSCTIEGLESECDYEFYVSCGEQKSRVRLARCGESFGTVVNYLHPDDEAYAFSGRYLCSPSIVRHPDGFLLASMDLHADSPQNLTLIFRSDDEGKSWKYVSELFPAFWTKLFVHRGALYALAASTESGDLLIGRSDDGGYTFCEPTVLLRGSNGKAGNAGLHKNPQPVVEFGGRLWNSFEWGSWGSGYHAMSVMSVPVDADLLDADQWAFAEPVKYDPNWNGTPGKMLTETIEGCLVPVNGKLYNYMRFNCKEPTWGRALRLEVDTEHPENSLQFKDFVYFPACYSKFSIKYHEKRGKYYSVATRVTDKETSWHRTLLSLMVSDDGVHWEVERDIIDKRQEDPKKYGFQYVDFLIEGDEILFLCRTAMNDANSYHNSNYSIFDRIKI